MTEPKASSHALGFVLIIAVAVVLDASPAASQDTAAPAPLERVIDATTARLEGALAPEVLPEGVALRSRFASDIQGLAQGAAVTIGGYRVGTVRAIGVRLPVDGSTIETDIRYDIITERVKFGDRAIGDEASLLQALEGLIDRGLRASVESPFGGLGPARLELGFAENAVPASLDLSGAVPRVPAGPDSSAELARLQADLIARVKDLPIEQLVGDLTATMQTLRDSATELPETLDRLSLRIEDTIDGLETLLTGEDTQATIAALRGSAESLRDGVETLTAESALVMAEVRGAAASAGDAADQAAQTVDSVGRALGGQAPIWRDIDRLLAETTGLVRNLKLFIAYLERHPEALLTGRSGGQR